MNALPHIYNFFESIRSNPTHFRQLVCDELLMTEFNCGLEHRLQPIWSQHNYFIFVLEGKKVWHTPAGAFDLSAGTCALVRKGACIVEQFFDTKFCLVMFFLPDNFISETLRPLAATAPKVSGALPPVLAVETEPTLVAYIQSMLPYFVRMQPPEKALLELKFRELLLNIAGNPRNREVLAYCCSLLNEPAATLLRSVMEDNFCYNLTLEEYAQLCNRSLSAFKRDFQKTFQTTPGKWLLSKRLEHARALLGSSDKTVSEVAFESGFENLSHFSRVFRTRYGLSPAGLRQQPVI